jgi:AraC family transcriptional regulator
MARPACGARGGAPEGLLGPGQLEAQLLRLGREVSSPGYASAQLIDAMCTSLLIRLARYLRRPAVGQQRAAGGLLAWQPNRITECLQELHGTQPKLADLAVQCGVSAANLSRSFRQAHGMTVHKFVEKVLVERAKRLLLSEHCPVKWIDRTLGYSDATKFCVAFARAAGETSSAFRRRALAGSKRSSESALRH